MSEDLLALSVRHTRAAIHDTQLTRGSDRDLDGGAGCGMGSAFADRLSGYILIQDRVPKPLDHPSKLSTLVDPLPLASSA
jgi:hypothetical protein